MTTTMTEPEMTCHELVELVTEYLEDAMAASDRQRLEQHLSGCGPCRRYLDQMRRTIQAVGQLHEEAIAPAARDDLLTVFRAWKSESSG
jgi:predicted anti-sigma-YlaC factor YlaD